MFGSISPQLSGLGRTNLHHESNKKEMLNNLVQVDLKMEVGLLGQ
jgi:hypothetical protein